ncbi:hypothetical protein [Vibrio parahaemolyticus]|uniref:hypothetical protein n=1 Tax=Vibrio parahaemolyticus TaxID=670 RepID=UPI002361D780|nr:hypothetical protein [Vibrio parahaemolyticus]
MKIDLSLSDYLFLIFKDYPDSFVKDIIDDDGFNKEAGLNFGYFINLDSGNVQFEDEMFMSSIISVFEGNNVSIPDQIGETWNLSLLSEQSEGRLPVVKVENDTKTFYVNEFWPLQPNLNKKLACLDILKNDLLLSEDATQRISSALSGTLTSSELINTIRDNINDSPSVFISRLSNVLTSRDSLNVETLVPMEVSYYKQLIGSLESSENIQQYLKNEGKKHSDYFLNNYGREGMAFLLNFNWIPLFSDDEMVTNFNNKHLDSLVDSIRGCNSIFLKFSLVDILLKQRPLRQNYLDLVADTTKSLMKDEYYDSINLLSFLYILTDAVLIKNRTFVDFPVFYRRYASLTHASLLYTCFCDNGVPDNESICEWISVNFGQEYYIGNLLDLRSDQRWLPDYAQSSQLLNEFVGRLYSSISVLDDTGYSFELNQRGIDKNNLGFTIDMFLPGPLEGSLAASEMPANIEEIITENLKGSESSSLDSFTAFINSSRYWQLDDKYSKSVVDIIRRSGYMLEKIESIDTLYNSLYGLSIAASIANSELLAEELLILTRVYKRELIVNGKIKELFFIGLLSSGAFNDNKSWCNYLGRYLNELMVTEIDKNEKQFLFQLISQVCALEPKIFTAISKNYVIFEEDCR